MQPCFRIQCLQIFKLYKLAVTWRLAISFDCWLDDSEWFGFSEHSAGRARWHKNANCAATPHPSQTGDWTGCIIGIEHIIDINMYGDAQQCRRRKYIIGLKHVLEIIMHGDA